MKKLWILVLAMLTINAHASFTCSVREAVENTVPEYVATVLECENSAAISEDLAGFFDGLNICLADDGKESFSAIACRVVATYAVDEMVKVIPTDWECKATTATELVKEALISRCNSFFGGALF